MTIEAYSQGLGSMITEPPRDGQRTALQEFETLYIGVRSLPPFAGLVGCDGAKPRLCAIAKENFDQDGSYRLGDSSSGNKHEVER